MKTFRGIFDRVEEYTLVTSLLFSLALIFVQVVMRYVFQSSLSWSEELARYLFVWQTWLGTSLAVKYNKHIRVDILKNYMNPKHEKYLDIVVYIIWIIFILLLAYVSWNITMLQFERNQKSPALEIPMGFAYAAVPVGCILTSFRLIQNLSEKFKTHREEV